MLLYYCENCKARIPPADVEAKTALVIDESRALCAKCAAAAKAARQSGGARQLSPAAGAAVPPAPEPRQSRTGIRPVTRSTPIEGTAGAAAARTDGGSSRQSRTGIRPVTR
ncbi:MAG: hypothetical protein NTW87_16485, partial [Planctomycetota bacterium]|nr:hypothetical protein [Planctomycetota bacterium]